MASDDRMVFCAAVDRNAYLPVHNRKYSLPLAAASRRGPLEYGELPYLIQVYPRDMGNGITIMMQEIDAPIRVFGKHWGGFRTAYKL